MMGPWLMMAAILSVHYVASGPRAGAIIAAPEGLSAQKGATMPGTPDAVLAAYAAAAKAQRVTEELDQAADRAEQAASAVKKEAEEVLRLVDEASGTFWGAVIESASELAQYIGRDGSGSSFEFLVAVDLARDLEQLTAFAAEKTDERIAAAAALMADA